MVWAHTQSGESVVAMVIWEMDIDVKIEAGLEECGVTTLYRF